LWENLKLEKNKEERGGGQFNNQKSKRHHCNLFGDSGGKKRKGVQKRKNGAP